MISNPNRREMSTAVKPVMINVCVAVARTLAGWPVFLEKWKKAVSKPMAKTMAKKLA